MGDLLMISTNLDKNIKYVDEIFKDWGDIVKRRFEIGPHGKRAAFVCYVDNLAARDTVEKTVMHGLMVDIRLTDTDEDIRAVIDGGITTADIKYADTLESAAEEVMSGNTMLLADGFDRAVIISSKGFPKRGVEKAENEAAVQGSKEAFTESLRVNTVLVRRRLKDTALKCVQLKAGKNTKTDVAVMYLDGYAENEVVNKVIDGIKAADTAAVPDAGYIEQFLTDTCTTVFPLVQLTERPDKVAAELIEGRVAILTDNSPQAILVPVVLASLYQASEDYYQHGDIMSFVRIIRYIAGFIAFALPGLYIAVTLHQPSMIAGELALKLAGARKSVPLPTVAEVIFMELAFEALREAGIRLPSAVGSTLGIVGGIVIGQAAVEAGLVSPLVVIVVALTAICGFAVPNVALGSAYRLVKYLIILLSAAMGVYGWITGILLLFVHLCSLDSFGVPYMYPFTSAKNIYDFKDSFIRAPLKKMDYKTFRRGSSRNGN